MSAEDAKEWGLIDEILEEQAQVRYCWAAALARQFFEL
jgi:enoyl-CoA hydratase/carnithine racemase